MSRPLSELTLEELWQLFPIMLSEYNPAWPKWYAEESEALKGLLGVAIRRLRHIGSTSVPGLTAKPTVDILLEIVDDVSAKDVRESLEQGGWTTMAEANAPDWRLDMCKGYTPEGFAERVFHLHVRRYDDWDEPYFCEYLRSYPDVAAEYVALKRELAVKFRNNRDAYTEAKTEFIRNITALARSKDMRD